MRIDLSPTRTDTLAPLTLERDGDTLIVCGEAFDLSPLEEGDELPADATGSPYFVGTITRTDGEMHPTLLLPLGAYPSDEARFPQPIIDTPNGPVPLPETHGAPPASETVSEPAEEEV